MSIVASVVDLVRPTTVSSLSHWASTFVYNTIVKWSASRGFVCDSWDLSCIVICFYDLFIWYLQSLLNLCWINIYKITFLIILNLTEASLWFWSIIRSRLYECFNGILSLITQSRSRVFNRSLPVCLSVFPAKNRCSSDDQTGNTNILRWILKTRLFWGQKVKENTKPLHWWVVALLWVLATSS